MQGVLSSGGLMEGLMMRATCFMQDMMVGGWGRLEQTMLCPGLLGCGSPEVVVLCVAVGV